MLNPTPAYAVSAAKVKTNMLVPQTRVDKAKESLETHLVN